ncbi:MAG: hypothetical protein IJB48_03230 [Clostridia bacterium]|nr:hypothetical protein [Clostridia bacterium]
MITNGDITVYHAEIDAETRKEVFKRQIIKNVSIYKTYEEERRHSQDGPWRSRECIIRVPQSEALVLAIGDRVVFGLTDEPVPSVDSLIVNGFSDNRRGSKRMWHYKIICR